MSEIPTQLLPGLADMANLHPLMVHFPIALFTTFFLTEILSVLTRRDSLRHAASWMLYFGTLGAAVTVATGLRAAATVPHGDEVHTLMDQHETYGFIVLGLGIFLSLWRMLGRGHLSAVGQTFHLLFGLVTVLTLAAGADLGGIMVYRHAVGVRAVPGDAMEPMAGDHDHDHDHQHGETPDAAVAEERPNLASDPPAAPAAPPPAPVASEAKPQTKPHRHAHDHPHTHDHSGKARDRDRAKAPQPR